nr:hypothetical protein GCM10020241_64160 [Streptoalloteichus tenebrarius]
MVRAEVSEHRENWRFSPTPYEFDLLECRRRPHLVDLAGGAGGGHLRFEDLLAMRARCLDAFRRLRDSSAAGELVTERRRL